MKQSDEADMIEIMWQQIEQEREHFEELRAEMESEIKRLRERLKAIEVEQ